MRWIPPFSFSFNNKVEVCKRIIEGMVNLDCLFHITCPLPQTMEAKMEHKKRVFFSNFFFCLSLKGIFLECTKLPFYYFIILIPFQIPSSSARKLLSFLPVLLWSARFLLENLVNIFFYTFLMLLLCCCYIWVSMILSRKEDYGPVYDEIALTWQQGY